MLHREPRFSAAHARDAAGVCFGPLRAAPPALPRPPAIAVALAAALTVSACSTWKAPSDPDFTEARGRVLTPPDEAVGFVFYLPGDREVLYASPATTGGGPPALVAVDFATGRRRTLHTRLFDYSNVYVLPGADGGTGSGTGGGAILFAAASVPERWAADGSSATLASRWGYYRLPLSGGPAEALVAPGELGTEGTPILGTDALAVALSPDSTRLGYTSAGQLAVYDLTTRTARALGPVVPNANANITFSADGTAVLAPRPGDPYSSLRTVSLADGQPGALIPPEDTFPAAPPERAEWETEGWGWRNARYDTYRAYNSTLYLLGGAAPGRHELARAVTHEGGTRTGGGTTQNGLSSVVVAPDGRGAVYFIEGRLYTNRLS